MCHQRFSHHHSSQDFSKLTARSKITSRIKVSYFFQQPSPSPPKKYPTCCDPKARPTAFSNKRELLEGILQVCRSKKDQIAKKIRTISHLSYQIGKYDMIVKNIKSTGFHTVPKQVRQRCAVLCSGCLYDKGTRITPAPLCEMTQPIFPQTIRPGPILNH